MERGILFGRYRRSLVVKSNFLANSLKSGLEIAQLVGIVSIPSPTIRNQLMTYILSKFERTLRVRYSSERGLC